MKHLLIEAYRETKKKTGIDPSKPGNMQAVILDDDVFNYYVERLSEGLEGRDKDDFKILAENTRIHLLEVSVASRINPYESLAMPVLRVFYPKLVIKEAVTVSPMDKPETVKAFIRAYFSPANSTTQYQAPVTSTDISGGPSIGTPVTATMQVPQSAFDVLAIAGTTSTNAHLERDFEITGVSNDGTTYVNVSIVPAVEGHFSSSVTILASNDDVISGQVNYLAGTVAISNVNGVANFIRYQVTCSLEENRINPNLNISIDKVRLYARDRQISTNWSINMEQDIKVLFDLSIQAEVVNILGQQIATDVNREVINALSVANSTLNAATHTGAFTRTPPASYLWGQKYWHENIVSELNQLSGQIYNDTNMGEGNTIMCNPLDSAILEDINTFEYTGTSDVNGDLGYRSATVVGSKWKVLTSSIVPQGEMIILFKPVEEIKCVYLYCPYVPAVLHPYPLGYTPSLTLLTRYATALVRANGIATLTINA